MGKSGPFEEQEECSLGRGSSKYKVSGGREMGARQGPDHV